VRKVEAQKPEPKAEHMAMEDLKKLEEGTVPWYRLAFALCEIDKGYESAVAASVKTVLNGKARYEAVASKVGIPWWIIGCLHFKEASCSFSGVLHNGEHIIGTGKKTKLVPSGRGPFTTWEEAAIDALTLNGGRWAKVKAGSKDIGELLYACERFNGAGYLSKTSEAGKQFSPYLWARTNIAFDTGVYTRDHYYDPKAPVNKTTGLAILIKEMIKMGQISL